MVESRLEDPLDSAGSIATPSATGADSPKWSSTSDQEMHNVKRLDGRVGRCFDTVLIIEGLVIA
jgi:hypothetical protein